MITKKIDSFTVEVTKQLPQPEPVKTQYQRDFIEKQILAVLDQKKAYDDARDLELDELYEILAEMDKLGIKVAEEIPTEINPE
jgi:hypothetical protein